MKFYDYASFLIYHCPILKISGKQLAACPKGNLKGVVSPIIVGRRSAFSQFTRTTSWLLFFFFLTLLSLLLILLWWMEYVGGLK